MVSHHRGQALYTCSCGWVGKERDTISAARRCFEKHLERLEPKAKRG